MRDKYNLNTLPAGIAGLEDIEMGGMCSTSFTVDPMILINQFCR